MLGPKTLLATVPAICLLAAASAEESGFSVMPEMCAGCHGQGGLSPGPIPSLAHLDAEAVLSLLESFREGEIEATVMNRIARGLTDAEIASLATYFGSLEE
ncbi:MAG: c-type cytochrome [Albidovulum sp.]|nr:c-type cytochrome [Albidovulum sp.]MDE0306691.1 c-type cytochrome [Albidovulum sp.]MDE0532662.1 c-type cytochrome [Albidovulum sp.]